MSEKVWTEHSYDQQQNLIQDWQYWSIQCDFFSFLYVSEWCIKTHSNTQHWRVHRVSGSSSIYSSTGFILQRLLIHIFHNNTKKKWLKECNMCWMWTIFVTICDKVRDDEIKLKLYKKLWDLCSGNYIFSNIQVHI